MRRELPKEAATWPLGAVSAKELVEKQIKSQERLCQQLAKAVERKTAKSYVGR